MIGIALHRTVSWDIARSDARQWGREISATDGKGKAPTSVVRMWLVGLDILDTETIAPAGSRGTKCNNFNVPCAVRLFFTDVQRHEHA
jgi:hypothetical protein